MTVAATQSAATAPNAAIICPVIRTASPAYTALR